jgi:hypothetical protein
MVSNHGCTCPFALILMNITMIERNSTYSFKMNVPKNCKEFEECLQIFNTTAAPAYPSVPMALWQRSRDWNIHCTQPIQQRFLCSNENIIASIQTLKLKYSIPPNLDILKKLDISEWYQSLTTQNQKTFYAFHVQRGHSQALGTEGYVAAPPGLKCCKKK